MRDLIENVIIPLYSLNRVQGGVGLPETDDGASIPLKCGNIVITTDASTVKPLFFPGGNIGRLAICGAVNDLSMMGAEPIALTTAIVAEEGFAIEMLRKVVTSMNEASEEVGVPIIAGDTKVVERGSLDEMIISTTGIGLTRDVVKDSGLNAGDMLIISGTIGNHQLALLSKREGIKFEAPLKSDVAPLWRMIEAALRVGGITAMKDPTRGGISGALNDMARKAGVEILLREDAIPMNEVVRSATGMLGLDPLELANEGIAVIGVEKERAQEVLKALRSHRYGKDAVISGEVREGPGRVVMETLIGGRRIVREPYGSPMPRIC